MNYIIIHYIFSFRIYHIFIRVEHIKLLSWIHRFENEKLQNTSFSIYLVKFLDSTLYLFLKLAISKKTKIY